MLIFAIPQWTGYRFTIIVASDSAWLKLRFYRLHVGNVRLVPNLCSPKRSYVTGTLLAKLKIRHSLSVDHFRIGLELNGFTGFYLPFGVLSEPFVCAVYQVPVKGKKMLLNIHSWQSSIAMYERKQINDPWLLDNHIYFLVYTESKKSRSNIIEIASIARSYSTAPIYSAFKCLVFHILIKVFAWNSVNSEFIKLS